MSSPKSLDKDERNMGPKHKSDLELNVEELMVSLTQIAKTLGKVQEDVAAILKAQKAGKF